MKVNMQNYVKGNNQPIEKKIEKQPIKYCKEYPIPIGVFLPCATKFKRIQNIHIPFITLHAFSQMILIISNLYINHIDIVLLLQPSFTTKKKSQQKKKEISF